MAFRFGLIHFFWLFFLHISVSEKVCVLSSICLLFHQAGFLPLGNCVYALTSQHQTFTFSERAQILPSIYLSMYLGGFDPPEPKGEY